MSRLTHGLQAGLDEQNIRAFTSAPSHDNWFSRFIAYPMKAGRVHADVYHVIDHSMGHAAAFLPKDRTIISCHDLYLLRARSLGPGHPVNARHLAQFKMSVSFLRRVAAVVALTEATKTDIVDLLDVDPAKITVISLGVDERFRPYDPNEREQVRRQLRFDRPVILHVGNSPYKNLKAVVRCLAEVRRNGIDAILAHVGDPIAGETHSLAEELGVAEHIRELGRVPDSELVDVMNSADVLLFPSEWEGMGWPPLEAMACGLPAVTSNIAPITEVTGDAALTADADDVRALSDHVASVLSDAAVANSLRARGLAQVRPFTWAQTTARYLDVYRSVLDRL